MPLHPGPRARLLAAALVGTAALMSAAALATTVQVSGAATGSPVAAADGAGDVQRLNTTTPTPESTTPTPDTETPTSLCTGPGCGDTPTATPHDGSGTTETPTPTPWCTGPGCGDTPSPTVVVEPPECQVAPDEACTPSPSPDRSGWYGLLRPLAALSALASAGLLAVGVVLVRWRVGGQ